MKSAAKDTTESLKTSPPQSAAKDTTESLKTSPPHSEPGHAMRKSAPADPRRRSEIVPAIETMIREARLSSHTSVVVA